MCYYVYVLVVVLVARRRTKHYLRVAIYLQWQTSAAFGVSIAAKLSRKMQICINLTKPDRKKQLWKYTYVHIGNIASRL